MALIPKDNNFHHVLNSVVQTEFPRAYLGLSQIGESCHRKLQYYHYWAYEVVISQRIRRLFDFGHMMEEQMIADLKLLDIECIDSQAEIIGTAGHWKGHADSIGYEKYVKGFKFLVEFKTHNAKSFQDVKKNGVLKSKPQHYDQMTAYCGYLNLSKSLYVAYNKNDSEYHTEWIPFDEERFAELKRKEMEIIASDILLPRIGNNSPAWFECKMCDARNVCFRRKEPLSNCRTCLHVDVLPEGKWVCGNSHTELDVLSIDQQKAGCQLYELGSIFDDYA